MALYYCINDVLDTLDRMDDSESRLNMLIPVSQEQPNCNGHPDDAFTLSSSPKLLDFHQLADIDQLAEILEKVPLYKINMELILDEALSNRHKNPHTQNALDQAFGNDPLPNTLKSHLHDKEDISGGLRHPMLGHLEYKDMCRIYIKFLQTLEHGQEDYGFARNILGKHIERFAEYCDGYIIGPENKVKAEILLGFGQRMDHDPALSQETHTKNCRQQAMKMHIEEPRELVWAWLEAENYQIRRCRDLKRFFTVKGLPKTPKWVQTDIIALHGKEAMKQVFAETLAKKDPEFALLSQSETLREAIQRNAKGSIDETLQQLFSQDPDERTAYAGTLGQFIAQAEKRAKESYKSGIN